MKVRFMNKGDVPRVKEIYEKQGFDYQFPNLDEFFEIPVLVDDHDQVVMAVGGIPTVELFFWIDQDWETPGMRFEALKFLHEFFRREMKSRGVIQGHVFIPPGMEKSFGRRLQKHFGWVPSRWFCLSRRVK